jgi:hypothetical protein
MLCDQPFYCDQAMLAAAMMIIMPSAPAETYSALAWP